MYYPTGVRYPDVGAGKEPEDDVLDLCVRKKQEKYGGDVNGNGFAENSNGIYDKIGCKSPEALLDPRYIRKSPTERIHPDGEYRILNSGTDLDSESSHRAGAAASPTSSQQFAPDSPAGAQMLPLPTTIPAVTRNGKPTRPFKAYPKGFLALATSEGLLDDSNKRYMEFRRQFLSQLHATNGLNGNKNMKRPVQSVSPNQLPSSSGDAKDQAYWERRKKNNEAAKKSRDARRAKEDEIAIRAAFLERENVRLKLELASLRSETDRLRCLLYSS